MGGPREAAASVAGAIVGHLWWWGVYHTRTLEAFGKAPRWLRAVIDGPSRPGNAGDATAGPGGVHVIPPRRVREEAAGTSSGYRWGTGQKLGGS
ncbi:hypothetical protein PHLCEN_2v2959 [Hermanssonia centrifuga]|uniref:Uncharacterized protein n=1 Tax=Hermanssonia centrifuga TaxID=98765 RepID=A0A2R6RHQ3_9APHY|nr:hypothetical protein PHLCEN_2v2959 [Hermanssonia centrifuga]